MTISSSELNKYSLESSWSMNQWQTSATSRKQFDLVMDDNEDKHNISQYQISQYYCYQYYKKSEMKQLYFYYSYLFQDNIVIHKSMEYLCAIIFMHKTLIIIITNSPPLRVTVFAVVIVVVVFSKY